MQVGGGDFVEEPEMDVAGAERGEAAVERGFGFRGSEGGAFWIADGGTGGMREALLQAGELKIVLGAMLDEILIRTLLF